MRRKMKFPYEDEKKWYEWWDDLREEAHER